MDSDEINQRILHRIRRIEDALSHLYALHVCAKVKADKEECPICKMGATLERN